ncbi:3-dehydroquinate synthase [Desulfohalotomaculum tongense]|uniref:3-dehydroquinate synthase n=1 Tax=Desulforadius tongensis TaxID=1216062 RepID=UPI00195DA89A|nr:3-dehydroquinate synthase [Desulforadius tongensis]MBM7854059.1 3-dehydroquinate synthase [Desulforadius tongensis]
MKTVLPVNLSGKSYHIIIGADLLPQIGAFLQPLKLGSKVLLATNPTVMSLYGKTVQRSLQQAGFKVTVAEVPEGEEAKSLEQAGVLYDVMFNAGLDRKSPVIALGGGVVGDLAGFAAATYMRGVPFIQVPTTLLAQVDSSVGGKVAVNHPRGKNIIGAFYQPQLVLTDTKTLSTLDKRDVLSGLAEVIKAAVIRDERFFNWLEENIDRVLALEEAALNRIIETSCQIKARVVEEDETEQGVRAVLNYGHTVGHGVETLSGYGTYRHGEAVAMGMVAEARIAKELGLINRDVVQRIETLIARTGLPTQLPGDLSPAELMASMYKDKKVLDDTLTFALISNIGEAVIKKDVPEEVILAAVEC